MSKPSLGPADLSQRRCCRFPARRSQCQYSLFLHGSAPAASNAKRRRLAHLDQQWITDNNLPLTIVVAPSLLRGGNALIAHHPLFPNVAEALDTKTLVVWVIASKVAVGSQPPHRAATGEGELFPVAHDDDDIMVFRGLTMCGGVLGLPGSCIVSIDNFCRVFPNEWIEGVVPLEKASSLE